MSQLTLKAIEELLGTHLKPVRAQLNFLTENMATKDDLFSETRPIKNQLTSIENKVDRLSVRSNEDVVATIKDVEKVSQRVDVLEKQLKKFAH